MFEIRTARKFDRFLEGRVRAWQRARDGGYNGSLPEYLGMLHEDYAAWVAHRLGVMQYARLMRCHPGWERGNRG